MLNNDLFPETLLVGREGDRVFTTSLKVAEHFHKRHTHVLRAIENLLTDLQSDCANLHSQTEGGRPNFGLTSDFGRLNFEPASAPDRWNRQQPIYRLSHDGFALVAMGFTGKEALKWKIDFLSAFRAMEEQIAAFHARESNALYGLRPKWKPIIQNPGLDRISLIGLTGHKSPGSITACRRSMRQLGLLDS